MHGSSHPDRGNSPCGRMNLMPIPTPGLNRSFWLVVWRVLWNSKMHRLADIIAVAIIAEHTHTAAQTRRFNGPSANHQSSVTGSKHSPGYSR